MFSSRLAWSSGTNRLTRAVEEMRARGESYIDLTVSNPTRVGLDYPNAELAEAMRFAATSEYAPDPRGSLETRKAIAASLSTDADPVRADELFLLASTSEAYSYLFKLLCDFEDEIVTARPVYPLLEHIAALEGVRLRHYGLALSMFGEHPRRRARWQLELADISAAITDRTRAIVVVHPNNPTGNYLSETEAADLASFCASRQIALISDEVFLQFPFGERKVRSAGGRHDALTFTLGGLSKFVGLPHFKLGWIRVSGPPELSRTACEALELIADSFLSLSTPVQLALPQLLAAGAGVRAQIAERTAVNLASLREAARQVNGVELLEPEGGWSAVIRVPTVTTDEELALLLLANGVLVQPGYFYDFERDGFLVVSLLPESDVFDDGVTRVMRTVATQLA